MVLESQVLIDKLFAVKAEQNSSNHVLEAVRFIRSQLSSPGLLQDVFKHAQVSRRTLERRFFEQLGCSIARAIRLIRLEQACQLLREDDRRSIIEISIECGFSSPTHMSHVFRRELNCSPRNYRMRHTS